MKYKIQKNHTLIAITGERSSLGQIHAQIWGFSKERHDVIIQNRPMKISKSETFKPIHEHKNTPYNGYKEVRTRQQTMNQTVPNFGTSRTATSFYDVNYPHGGLQYSQPAANLLVNRYY